MDLILLSQEFYAQYAGCKEILRKQNRPYVCLSVYVDGICFAIPFRHHISHGWAFITYDRCGLDYTKAVVLSDTRFIGQYGAVIEQTEFNRIKSRENAIARGMAKYLRAYKNAVKYPQNPRYRNILSASALQYFHQELGL